MKPALFALLLLTASFFSCTAVKRNKPDQVRPYIPADQELYEAIVGIDRAFFDAYNTCDLEKQASIYADAIEFYHDQGGLSTSKQDILDATERNICGKVTRELVAGSIEVYPIKGYGAVEMGFHQFHNSQEPEAIPTPSKFVIMWKDDGGKWEITKVISLH
ncbi:nuclear transport factor 2 family protein [Pontibacter sp. E15-1]|uniref:nuclear transport factor 2 family protein n=1 Tax=Pontibacter sp. E15-1 TaxID=2919918 RepID=UPI001F503AAE|nr:nuclear transport factor 2 family protein [Pontibacter sp. E15-1]MCJ8167578.1 nuclear transport factor 2 family protein [Pontibacter sp. E15-1]